RESIGIWQAAVQARVWREVWIAGAALKRGEPVRDAELAREKRDLLTLKDTVADFAQGDAALELAEPVQTGAPLLARSVKLRPVVHRGQTAAALLQDGTLMITMKVEALEDGAPGQVIRARNPISHRDLRGTVVDHGTIIVSL